MRIVKNLKSLSSQISPKSQITHSPFESLNFSEYINLKILNLGRKNVKELDLSKNKQLTKLYYNNSFGSNGTAADNGILTSLNLANGNNSNMIVEVGGHLNLSCIKVDSGFNPAGKWDFNKLGLQADDKTITICN